MTLYLYVTPDEYELPICVSDSVTKLVNKLGLNKSSVESIFSRIRSGKYTSRKFKIVEVEDD